MGHFLDLDAWHRREHFHLFRVAQQPFFSVTTEVDVSAIAARGGSFTVAALWAAMRAAHETPAMRYRVRDDRVWVHDRVRLSTTVMRDDDSFGFAVLEPCDSFARFEEHARAELARAREIGPLTVPTGDDIVYHSTLPWFRFTAFTNARHLGDSVPRVVYGKRAGSLMPVSLEVHHAVMDGLDVHRFLTAFSAKH